MTAKSQNPLRMIGEQIHAIIPSRPLYSQDQSQLAGARVIESYESVPPVYRPFFEEHLSEGGAFPYTVLTPTYETADGSTITEKLLYTIEHTFYVLEERGNKLVKVCYPIDEIHQVEVTHRAAELRFKVSGLTHLGLASSSVFGCDNTTDSLFVPIFQRIRLRIVSLNDHAPSRHMERLDHWNDLHTTIVDMARHCLMAGETVIQAVLQPEISPSIFSIKDRTRQPSHICILTDKELVMIREHTVKGIAGSICNFIPVNKITAISMSRKNDNLLTVSIRLTSNDVFESLFTVSLENEVDQFLTRTREFLPRERMYIRD